MIGIKFKIDFSGLERQLKELERAVTQLPKVSFNPQDQADVQRAIREYNTKIDLLAARYPRNDLVKQFVRGIKERAKQQILAEVRKAKNR